MNDSALRIEADWESLTSGSPEERAAFASIAVLVGDRSLTEAEDYFAKRVRSHVYLSGYHLAEWLAWNWWRLRWEPRRPKMSLDWQQAHNLASIGAGYVWPNITISSDGQRVALHARPTVPSKSEPVRYIAQHDFIVPAGQLETAIDQFVAQVLEKLQAENLLESNLARLWSELLVERSDAVRSRFRKLEALLGYDAGEADVGTVSALLEDSKQLSEEGVGELALETPVGATPLNYADLARIAEANGIPASRDFISLANKSMQALPSNTAAWKRGVAAAIELRKQERLGELAISDRKLEKMAGIWEGAVRDENHSKEASFLLTSANRDSNLVLGTRYPTGRRFAVARLIGDRVASGPAAQNFRPITKSYSYRQQLQRAFAGEFLCPFDALMDQMRGNFDDDAIVDAASNFDVSERTVTTMLVNHGKIDRGTLEFQEANAA